MKSAHRVMWGCGGVMALCLVGALSLHNAASAIAPRDVILDPSDLSLPDLEALTFDAVVADITEYLDTEADPVRLKIPKFIDLGVLTVDEAEIEFATVTETITIAGPMTLNGADVEVELEFDWDESTGGLVPDDRPVITVAVDYAPGIGNAVEVTIGDAIDLINDFAGTSFDSAGQSPDTGLIQAGFTFTYDTDDRSAALDLEGEFRLDEDPDDLIVGVLLSMTDPAGAGAASLLTGVRLSDAEIFDDEITLLQGFRGVPGLAAFAGEIELPEVTMSMVSPAGAIVKKTCGPADPADCIELRARPLAWFGSLAADLPDDFAPDNTLTLAAALRLDSLGPGTAETFGYGPGESVLLTGALGFDVTDLTEATLNLIDVSLEARLPTLSAAAQGALPDWLELSDGVLRVEYDDDNEIVVLGAEASSRVHVPSQGIDVSVDVEAQISIEADVASIAIDAAPAAGNAGWNDVFGLDWLDLTSVGVEVRIIAPEGGDVDVTGAITSSFDIAGEPFSVRLEVELTPTVAATVTVSYDGSISVYDVLDTVGIDTSALPSDLDVSVGPVSVTARIDDGPLQLSVGAEGTFALLGNGSAEMLFALRGDDVVFGVRSETATLSSFISDNPFDIDVEIPMIALVGTSVDFEENSFNLSHEEDEFWRAFHGCPGDPRPANCAGYTVEVDAGLHVMASFPLPDGPLRNLLPLLWIDPTSSLLLDASAPFPAAGGPMDLSQLRIRAVLPAIVPPVPNSPDAVDAYPDWFERARLAFEVSPEGFEIVGELRIRLRDGEVDESTSASKPSSCIRSWLETVPGAGRYACYDRLDFEIGAGIQLTTPPKLTLSGALLTQPGVGWPEPFGLDFLRIDAARIQLGLAPTLTGGLSVDLGFLAAGALFDKDFSGSIAMGLVVQPSPPPVFVTVVPTFNGIRLSTQAGIELADFVELYDYVADTASALGLPDVAPDLSSLPNISFRNLDLMVGFASYPDLCIEPGIKLGGTFHINAPPLTSAPQNPPGGCNPGLPAADPAACAIDPHCFASALLVATPDDGIIVAGSLGEFDVGVLRCEQALLDFRLTPTRQLLKVQGGCEVPALLRGSVDIYVGLDGVAFRGDVELFPDADGGAFRAAIEGEASADLGQVDLANPATLLALDFDLHAVLDTDFTGTIQQALAPLIEDLRLTASVIDATYSQLLSSGDPLEVILDLPATIEAAGGDVPQWLEDFADGVEELRDTLEDYGLTMPSINDALGGFTYTVTEGVDGYYEPSSRECQKLDLLGNPNGYRGTIIDGDCWDDPPGGPFGYERRGEFVDPSCRSAFDLPGFVIDGHCWAVPPVEVDIPGLSDLVPGVPSNFADLTDDVEAIFAGILEPIPGVPNNLSLSALLDDLADGLSGIGSPVEIECVDFRLDSAEGSADALAALRFKVALFGEEFGLDAEWDFSQHPLGQATALLDDVVATVFGTAPPVECEALGTTTIGAGSGAPTNTGGDPNRPSLTGFTVEVTPDEVDEGSSVTISGAFNTTVPAATDVTIDWGDGSPIQTLTVASGQSTFAPSHTYVDDDPTATSTDVYLVRVSAIDKTESVTVTVRNVAPSGLTLAIDDVNEGAVATLHGEFDDPGDGDSHTVRVNWGDGTATQQISLGAGIEQFAVTHVYVDDNPTGTSADDRAISVTVIDDDAGQVSSATSVTVRNVAPSGASLTPRGAITEGRFVKYDLAFADPGIRDTHTVTIDWGDGTPAQTLYLGPGIGVNAPLPVGHRYLDDNPTDTPVDIVGVTVSITDDDLGASGALPLAQTVLDVAPEIELEVIDDTIDEGDTVRIVGSISDPGELDTYTLTVDWGHAAIADTVVSLPAGSLGFEATAVFGDNGNYTIVATVVDDDTLSGSAADSVAVANVAPTADIDETGVMAPNPPSGLVTFIVRAGTPLSLSARSDDPGSDDLTFTWDFDTRTVGQIDSGTRTNVSKVNPPSNDPALSPTVQPRQDVVDTVTKSWSKACLYEVGLTVGDDDGGSANDAVWVVVTGTSSTVRNSGWWYNAYGTNRKPVFSAQTLDCYRLVVNHVSAVFGPSGSGSFRVLDTTVQVRDLLNTRQTSDANELMMRPLAATWLNLANGSLRWDQVVDTDGDGIVDTPISQVLRTAEAVRIDPNATRSELLAQEVILNRINGS